MHEALDGIRQRALVDNPYFQTASVARQKSQLAGLPLSGQDMDRFVLLGLLAQDYRRLGKIELAVEHLQAAEQLRAKAGLVIQRESETQFLFEIGLTYLRLAETENCVHCQTGESCILPIQGEGIHQKRIGSRKAVEYFTRVLQRDPQHLSAKWLLNIAAMTLGEFPDEVPPQFRLPPGAFESPHKFPRFLDIAGAVGLKTVNCGGGVITQDFDEDGLIDVLTSTWDPAGQIHYFRNTGDGTFSDQTATAGLTGLLGGINLIQGDFDNDGHVDALVLRGAWLAEQGKQPCSLLKNLGGGRFRDVTFDVGLGDIQYPTPTAGWSDYDNDGDLDLYVGHEVAPSQLYRNDGQKGFTNVTSQAGVSNDRFAKAVA